MAARSVRSGRFCAAALVAVLHLGLLWMLLSGKPPLAIPREAPPLSGIFFVPVTHPPAQRRPPLARRPGRVPRGQSQTAHFVITRPIATSRTAKRPARARINWLRAMRAEVRSTESRTERPPKVRIGFPGVPERVPLQHRFGWDYAATHRIRELPTGGILVMINDHCAIVFAPLPFGGCALGKLEANGGLFKHMNEPRNQGLGSLR